MPSIRRHLQVRRRWFLAGFVAFFVLPFALEVLAVPVAGLIMLPLFAALVFGRACVRHVLAAPLPALQIQHRARHESPPQPVVHKPIHVCPYCGVHLDEPVEPPVKATADIAARPQRD